MCGSPALPAKTGKRSGTIALLEDGQIERRFIFPSFDALEGGRAGGFTQLGRFVRRHSLPAPEMLRVAGLRSVMEP